MSTEAFLVVSCAVMVAVILMAFRIGVEIGKIKP